MFAIITMSIGQFAARRRGMIRLLSSCFGAGTILSWLGLRRTRVVVLGWESMECILHGEISYSGSIRTTKTGLSVTMEKARAFRSGFAGLMVRVLEPTIMVSFIGSYKHHTGQQTRHLLLLPRNSSRSGSWN